uniref:Glutaredoxin domain-containing protein n=1 Tax=Chaetoceros debilis TaxID=122233 RepID=A0A7S3PYV4_9STRA
MMTNHRLLLLVAPILGFLLSGIKVASAEVLSTGEEVSSFVTNKIADHDVMIFAKTYCPYCRRTKSTFIQLLSDLGMEQDDISFNVIELDEQPADDGWMIQNFLMDLTAQRTVPNVFIRGQHIGGNDDVQKLMRDESLHDLVMPHVSEM